MSAVTTSQRLSVAKSKVQVAMLGGDVTAEETAKIQTMLDACKGNTISIELCEVPSSFLENLLKGGGLSDKQQRCIAMFTIGNDMEIADLICESPQEFHMAVQNMLGRLGKDNVMPNMEMRFNGTWYPVRLESNYEPPREWGGDHCMLTSSVEFGEHQVHSFNFTVYRSDFEDDDGQPQAKTVRDMLIERGLRLYQGGAEYVEFVKQTRHAEAVARKAGTTLAVVGKGIVQRKQNWWSWGLQVIDAGVAERPGKVVVEHQLETEGSTTINYGYGSQKVRTRWPFIRVFHLERKEYLLVDVRDTTPYAFQEDAMDQLVLPGPMLTVLRSVFQSDSRQLFGDTVKGKHGGMIVMADGPSGVGKTMTAEVYAETTKRPLYVMEMGELGTNLADVEKNLQRIFARASRWNAVLLFDEADVFLAQRDSDLNRAAIVGVFLRLLDYYPGLMFLTSNRGEIIDKAFKSRVTLYLKYPALDESSRRQIWAAMLEAAGMVCEDGLDGVPSENLNGRQIRNLVRLLRVMHPNGRCKHADLLQICEYAMR
jgi:hypothetical protein